MDLGQNRKESDGENCILKTSEKAILKPIAFSCISVLQSSHRVITHRTCLAPPFLQDQSDGKTHSYHSRMEESWKGTGLVGVNAVLGTESKEHLGL